MVSGKCTLALGLGLGLWGLVGAQNHALRSDHVVVNTQRHWGNWAFVEGTLDISASGESRSSLRAQGPQRRNGHCPTPAAPRR